MKAVLHLLVVTGIALILLTACLGQTDESVDATAAALSEEIEQRGTATEIPPTETPIPPTETPIPTPTVDRLATTAAELAAEEATETAEAAATATAAEPILAELPNYGVDPANGELAWIQNSIVITASQYMTAPYANQRVAAVARDFVLSADVTWNTQYGTSGCGYVIRSDGDSEGNYDQYIVLATRAGAGEVLFVIMEDGEVKRNEITEIFAGSLDPQFDWRNDTTNEITVVGRGNTFEIFTNGTRIAEVTPSVVFEEGFVAFVVPSESGRTYCEFNDAWLWRINE